MFFYNLQLLRRSSYSFQSTHVGLSSVTPLQPRSTGQGSPAKANPGTRRCVEIAQGHVPAVGGISCYHCQLSPGPGQADDTEKHAVGPVGGPRASHQVGFMHYSLFPIAGLAHCL